MKKWYRFLPLLLIPVLVSAGIQLWNDEKYMLVSIGIAILACVPFFLYGEKALSDLRSLLIVAVMTTLSVGGRFIFTLIPHFNPATAITIIAGFYLGPSAGFMTGALGALISNFYFGQGAWTPFQMIAWGITGFLAGFLPLLKRTPLRLILLAVYSFFAVFLYSVIVDISTVLFMYNKITLSAMCLTFISSLPFTLAHAISNVIFIAVLAEPFGKKLARVGQKFGLVSPQNRI